MTYARLMEQVDHAVRERLDGRRLEHSLGCAQTAVLLADLYGVDPHEAYLAGMLHDWDKALDAEEVRARARAVRPDLDVDDPAVVPALHSFTGALAVRERFPELSEEVVAAIARHTVADTVMSPLDCVLYVADMIEPTRGFDGVDSLREAAGTVSLEVLFLEAYKCTLIHLVREGRALFPETARIYNAAVEAVGR